MLIKIRANSLALLCAVCAFVVGLTAAVAATVYKPSGGSTGSSVGELKLASPFSQNFVVDKPIIFIPATSQSNLTVAALVSMGTGTVTPTAVAASEIGGLLMNSDNDSHSFLMPIPTDIDLGQEITFRAIWSESDTGVTGSVRWYFLYKQLTIDSTVMAAAASTMTTDGAADPDLASEDEIQASPWSTLAASSLTGTPGDDFLIIKTYADVTSVSKAALLGVQIRYSRRFLGGDNY